MVVATMASSQLAWTQAIDHETMIATRVGVDRFIPVTERELVETCQVVESEPKYAVLRGYIQKRKAMAHTTDCSDLVSSTLRHLRTPVDAGTR